MPRGAQLSVINCLMNSTANLNNDATATDAALPVIMNLNAAFSSVPSSRDRAGAWRTHVYYILIYAHEKTYLHHATQSYLIP